MLQLQTKSFDICRISKLLVKYNIKASISDQTIILDGDISNELLRELYTHITIRNVQNFNSEVFPHIQSADDSSETDEMDSNITEGTAMGAILTPTVMEEYDLLYPTVKRGEVYLCDFGTPYGCEQGKMRYAIIVQNNDGNLFSPTTIVLPCTTKQKNMLPVQYEFFFSKENMIDYDVHHVGAEQNTVMAEQIKTVDKTRLRKYIGTMTSEFMDIIQKLLEVSLNLKMPEKVVTKTETVYVDKPVYKYVPVNTNTSKERRDLNMVQIKLLSLVDINQLIKISQTNDSSKIKAEKIIMLFGFDMQKNGVQYLLQAILSSPKDAYFNLETLCDNVASEHNIEKNEIMRLIVARIKEQFKFKKAPTIDFIRLVNSFLIKEEDHNNEKDNI